MRKAVAVSAYLIPATTLAQTTVPHDPEMDDGPRPPGYGLALVVFILLLWAMLAKNGILHDWAERNSGLALVVLLIVPFGIGWLLG